MDEKTEAPRMVQGGKKPAAYGWKYDGGWIGADLEILPIGTCSSCGWANAPLKTEGQESRCCLCWQADQRRIEADRPLQCETFCEAGQTPLRVASRVDPGGTTGCLECREKMLRIKAEAAQEMGQGSVGRTAAR